jgi:hypothetical protein
VNRQACGRRDGVRVSPPNGCRGRAALANEAGGHPGTRELQEQTSRTKTLRPPWGPRARRERRVGQVSHRIRA